jgi:hypothetical protein
VEDGERRQGPDLVEKEASCWGSSRGSRRGLRGAQSRDRGTWEGRWRSQPDCGCIRRCQSSRMPPIHGMLARSVDCRSVATTAPPVDVRGINFFTVLTAGNLESRSDESRLLGNVEYEPPAIPLFPILQRLFYTILPSVFI